MRINVNNIELNYEKIGDGKPLIFLHGNGEDNTIFDSLTKALSPYYSIYLIDSRGHGKSSIVNEFHYEIMSEDIYQFINKLNLNKPALFGFSDGGIIGLLMGIKHPNLLSRLLVAGVNINPLGIQEKARKDMISNYKISSNPLLKLMIEEPNITKEDLQKIVVPTMIFVGEHDVIKKYHTKMIHKNIKNSKLEVMLKHTHDSYITHQNILKNLIIQFIA